MLAKIAEAMLYILPAYCANGAPVLFTRLFPKLHPLDMGYVMRDGRRLLGDGKTLEGLFVGITSGVAAGLFISIITPHVFRSISEPLTLGMGAMAGDIAGSFVKRRLGIARGDPAPILDQLDFLAAALLLEYAAFGAPEWMSIEVVTLIMMITIALHVLTNYLAYKLGLKGKPW